VPEGEAVEKARFILRGAAIAYTDSRGEPVVDGAAADLEKAACLFAAASGVVVIPRTSEAAVLPPGSGGEEAAQDGHETAPFGHEQDRSG
jgi:hypothetical protein